MTTSRGRKGAGGSAAGRGSSDGLRRLAAFVTEREAVRKAKEAGRPKPWTTDPILQSFRFTCPRRMDDKVSRWLLGNWYAPYKDHPNMLAAAVLARMFNVPDTLTWFTNLVFRDGEPDWSRIKREATARRANGNTIFSAAYMVTGTLGGTKIEQVVDKVTKPLWRGQRDGMVLLDTGSMQRTHAGLCDWPGLKSFMSGQVVADLRWAMSGRWADRKTWAPVGPGSARGLARLLYRADEWESVAKDYRSTSERTDGAGAWLSDFREHVLGKLPPLLPGTLAARMEAMDYQNCLCEFDKYERARLGQGRPKQLYPGTST